MKEKRKTPNKGKSFDSLNDYASARAVAIGAGDLSVVIRREVKMILEKNKNNILKSLNSGLDELLERGHISTNESDDLKIVFKHLINSIRSKEDGEKSFLAIRSIYHDMLINQHSNPTALAIASVVNSAFNLEKSNSLTFTPESTGAGAAVGAVIGGIIGGFFGPGGAALGAAIGGAGGASIGWCNETGN